MSSIENDLSNFNQFAKDQIAASLRQPNIDELFDAWRVRNPPEEDLLAIKASLRDLDSGETGKPVEQFNQEIASKYDLNE